MIPVDNPLVFAWRAVGAKGAKEWEDIARELAAVRVKDIEEVLGCLAKLPEEGTDADTVALAAFCYAACTGPLEARPELTKRAAVLLQRMCIVGGTPPNSLPTIVEAEEKFPLRSRLDRYYVARQVAQAPWASKRVRRRASRRQLGLARELAERQPRMWQPLAEALVDAASDQQAEANYGRAQTGLEEAVDLCESAAADLDDWGVTVSARAHLELGSVLRAQGQATAARSSLEQAESLLVTLEDRLPAKDHAGMLLRVLVELSELAEDRGDHSVARAKIEEALGLVGDGAELWLTRDLFDRMVRIARKADGERGAKEALECILREHGIIAAALAGHEQAREIHSVAFGNPWSLRDAFREGGPDWPGWDAIAEVFGMEIATRDIKDARGPDTGHMRPRSRQDRLVQLLNLDPELVDRWSQELLHEKALLRNREWLPEGQLPGGVAEKHAEWERWRAVRILQELAAAVVAAREQPGGGAVIHDSEDLLRFARFRIEDVEVLNSVLARAEQTSDLAVMADEPGDASSILNYACPEDDWHCGPLPPEEPVDLIILNELTGPFETRALDVWIAQGLRSVVDALLFGEPDLRRCRMPRGVLGYLDYLLGKGNKPEECGRYYVPERRDKDTCGDHTCETYHGQIGSYARLSARAEQLAERYWKKKGEPGVFTRMWDAAQNGRTPKDALAYFEDHLPALAEKNS